MTSVTSKGNVSRSWANYDAAGSSSSLGRAITRLATSTCTETAVLIVKRDLDNKEPMKGTASHRILTLIAELESEGLF